MIYLLFVLLLLALVGSFLYFKKDYAAPTVLFIAGFVYCVGWACAYALDWGLVNMRTDTFWTILGGCLVFLITSVGVHILFKKFKPEEKEELSSKSASRQLTLNIPIWLRVVSIIFMIVTMVLSIKSVIDITGGSWSKIPAAINTYDQMSKFSSEILKIPLYMSFLRMAAAALAYWFIYVFISNLFVKKEKWWKRIDWLSLLIVGIDAMILFSSGGRNGVVNLLIAGIALFVMLYYKNYGNSFRLKPKWWLLVVALFAGFLIAFPKINAILGRSVAKDTNYYLAIYSGAEIKNLDMFLEKRENGTFANSGNNQTFVSINNTMMKAFHYGTPYKLDLPFQSTTTDDGRTLTLGNVYTTFYQFIYDFGFWGVLWCTALAAAISQFIYEKCRRVKLGKLPNVYILMYGYMSSSFLLSFFSNKFYEQNFNKAFIFNVIFWIVMNFLLLKIITRLQKGTETTKQKNPVKEKSNGKKR